MATYLRGPTPAEMVYEISKSIWFPTDFCDFQLLEITEAIMCGNYMSVLRIINIYRVMLDFNAWFLISSSDFWQSVRDFS